MEILNDCIDYKETYISKNFHRAVLLGAIEDWSQPRLRLTRPKWWRPNRTDDKYHSPTRSTTKTVHKATVRHRGAARIPDIF